MNYDYKRLRKDLIEEYTAAIFCGFPMAMIDAIDVEKASNEKLLQYAKEARFDLKKYIVKEN